MPWRRRPAGRSALRAILAALLAHAVLAAAASAAPLSARDRARVTRTGIVGADVLDVLATQPTARVMIAFSAPGMRTAAGRGDAAGTRLAVRTARETLMRLMPPEEAVVRRTFQSVNALALDLTPAGLLRLAQQEGVERIDLDLGGSAHLAQAVPLMHLDVAHSLGYSGAGVHVAVLDTGLDTDHPDLQDSLVAEECICGGGEPVGCCPDGTSRQSGPGSAEDDHGHGTNVTGIVVSNGTVAPPGGAKDAGIVAIKVLDRTSSFCCSADIVAALDWIANSRPDVRVVNLSLGTFRRYAGNCDNSDATTMAFAGAIDALRVNGVTVFASSGNQRSGTEMPAPGCVANAISVGAVWDSNVGSQVALGCSEPSTEADQVTCFSNSNDTTDLFAPGAPIRSTGLRGATSQFSGTSQASPAAAACAAVLLQVYPDLTPDQIEAALESSPVLVTDETNGLSFPRVDCEASLLSLGPLPPTPSRTPTPTITDTATITPTATVPPPTDTPTLTPTIRATDTPAPTRTPPGCAGDCDNSHTVSIDELVLGVGIALEEQSVDLCLAADLDGDRKVIVNELVSSVGNALGECG